MEEQKVTIKEIGHLTHDTLQIITERPRDHYFKPGQATDVAIDKEGWRKEKRPFTFTSLPEDNHLEFIIKTYPEKDGTTDKLLELNAGDNLLIGDVFGAITYHGEKTFIAGGAGITPFISILRDLKKKGNLNNHKLLFSNKEEKDIILHDELRDMLGDNFINILSREKKYHHGHIDKNFIRKHAVDLNKYFYLCGSPGMGEDIDSMLKELGVKENKIVKEQ